MSNRFKNWTSEKVEANEQAKLAKRLDAQPAVKHKSPTLEDLVIPKSLTMGIQHADGGPITNQPIKNGKIVAMGGNPLKTAKAQPEYKIQAAFVKKMAERFPGVMVFSDCAAHIKKTMIQQQRANALSTPGEKWPDVFIAQPSGDYAGLYLEFKAETPYRKDGIVLLSNQHIEAQALTMTRLRSKGYRCDFVWTVEQAIETVEKYLNL